MPAALPPSSSPDSSASSLPPSPAAQAAWRAVWAADPETAMAMAQAKPSLLQDADAAWWQAALGALDAEQLPRVLHQLGDPTAYPWATEAVCTTVLRQLCNASTFDWALLPRWIYHAPPGAVRPFVRALTGAIRTAIIHRPASPTAQPPLLAVRVGTQLLAHLDRLMMADDLVDRTMRR